MWYRDAKWRGRLLAEQEIMRERFPQFHLVIGRDGQLRWEGVIEPIARAFFDISITYPPRYPYEAPLLRVDKPSLGTGVPHLYTGGTLCVHRVGWEPLRGTAASMVPLVAAWVTAYLYWRETGQGW